MTTELTAPELRDKITRALYAASEARLVALGESIMERHQISIVRGGGLVGGRYVYCDTCCGQPAWPSCPEVVALAVALGVIGGGYPEPRPAVVR